MEANFNELDEIVDIDPTERSKGEGGTLTLCLPYCFDDSVRAIGTHRFPSHKRTKNIQVNPEFRFERVTVEGLKDSPETTPTHVIVVCVRIQCARVARNNQNRLLR